jgi:hypothetical protein
MPAVDPDLALVFDIEAAILLLQFAIGKDINWEHRF